MLYKDALYHYGVIGMRWGHRKGRDTASPATKRYKKHLESGKLTKEQRSKYEKLLKDAESHDKRMNDYVKSLSTGKMLAQQLIFNPFGAATYASLRADKVSRGKAFVKATLAYNSLGLLARKDTYK